VARTLGALAVTEEIGSPGIAAEVDSMQNV
jgi:hypothetical protein